MGVLLAWPLRVWVAGPITVALAMTTHGGIVMAMAALSWPEGAENVYKDSFLCFGRLLPFRVWVKTGIFLKIVIKRDFRIFNGQMCGF